VRKTWAIVVVTATPASAIHSPPLGSTGFAMTKGREMSAEMQGK
jgi:hypothetical protein